MSQLRLVIGNQNYSSWSLRPWLAMKQAGLEFETIRIPLYQPKSAALLRQYSPSGKVPVLIHDQLTVWDSLAICEYLAETFPSSGWFPEAKAARATARSICAEMHAGFQSLRNQMPMNCRAYWPSHPITSEVQGDIDRITTIWQQCRQQFGAAGAFLFDRFTIADAMYAPVVLRFKTYGVRLDAISQAYAEAILALPAMQAWLQAAQAETEQILGFELGN